MENKSKLHEDRFSSEKILLEPDYLTDYLQLKKHEVADKNNKEIRNILEYMILGYGLHVIVSELGIQSTLSLAERTIRRKLNDCGLSNVDKLMANYYRLLLFPMLQAGEKHLIEKYNEENSLVRKYKKHKKVFKSNVVFREGASEYLGTLTYNIVSNLITMPILFAYSPITSNVNQLSEFFNKLARAQNSKLSEFANDIGFDSVQLDSWIFNAMKKMEISVNDNAELVDDLTGEVITTIGQCKI
ncbi:MAG: hypothetical protein D8B48_09215 [Granulicatella sp.]|nr:MAG: hypothetical protein D8B48_09215 [Granulicatella sp.]